MVAAVAVAVVAAAAVVGSRYYIDRKMPAFGRETVLYVYPDTQIDEILMELKTSAEPRNTRSLDRVFRHLDKSNHSKSETCEASSVNSSKSAQTGVESSVSSASAKTGGNVMKPGRYVVKTSYPAIYVVRMLANGWQEPFNFTLSGTIRTKERLAQKISTQMMVDSISVINALNDEELLGKFGFTPENVFAMFLPDTYQMYWTATIEEIFGRFKKEYDSFWTPQRLEQSKNVRLTPMEVSILASIVSGETNSAKEYPVITGVYLNRLRKGMKLQADPTVCFCFDYKLNRVLKCHLTVDSPYNTYKYAGLPPAPINVPPKPCIDAVLNPAGHNYLYFCASSAFDGTHKFAASFTEHKKNARDFQSALTKREKAKAAS